MTEKIDSVKRAEKRKPSSKQVVLYLKKYVKILLGSMLYSLGVSLFLDPNYLAPGGVTGISIILSKFIPIETGTLILVFNIPILALGFWKFGGKFLFSTLFSILVTSGTTNYVTTHFGAVTNDSVLAVISGSVLMAIGLGTVIKAGATTGGSDILIRILKLKFPYLKTGNLYLITDAIVVSASALAFRQIDRALYAGVAVFLTSYVLDLVLYGRDGAKQLMIISEKPETIANRILEELDAGVTFLEGKGAFTKENKLVILCIVKKQISPKVEEIVKEEDSSAFMIISDAREVFGEGYKSYFGMKY